MEGEKREIVEKKVYEEGKKEYAGKGVAGTGLGLGIAGTALGLMSLFDRGNGLHIGGNTPENVNINAVTGGSSGVPSTFQMWEKETDDVLSLTNEMWNMKVITDKRIASVRERDINEKFGLYKSQMEMGFGLYKSQRDLYDNLNEKYSEKFNALDKKVAVMEATRPYQDMILQDQIGKALDSAISYTDKKTCRAIYGVVGLPSTPTVPVLEGANPFGYVYSGQPQVQQPTSSKS